MGRFAEAAPFYRFREAYLPGFFAQLAATLQLTGAERLLDVGCGPAPLALGMAPFVASVTGVDPEAAMLDAAREAAAASGVALTLVPSRLEDLPLPGPFDVVMLGRSIHWLDRAVAPARIEGLLSPHGIVVVARPSTTKATPWLAAYRDARRRFSGDEEAHRAVDLTTWFAASRLRPVGEVRVRGEADVTVAELTARALSYSTTSPAVLGARREAYEEAIRAAVEPFAHEGTLREEIDCVGTLFR